MKRPSLLLSMLLAMTTTLSASTALFYLGTYTNTPPSLGIYLGSLDTDTGKLGTLTLAAPMKNPSFVALSPDRKFLYAVTEAPEGSVSAFRVNDDKTLTFINSRSAEGAASCHLSVDSTGRNVLAANYNGGNVIVFPVGPDGGIGPRQALIPFTGASVHPQRQTKPHAHSIYPVGTRAYACDLGTDSIRIFQFDPQRGTLTPNDPPAFKGTPGAGPRHLAISGDGRFFYLFNELTVTVSVLAHDTATGALKEVQTVSTLPENAAREGASGAAVKLHPNGKFLYASNRGHDSISVFAVGADGRLSWIENVPAGVQMPRDFSIDPSGKWLIASGQKDGRIAVLKVDPATGTLAATDQSAHVGTPVCVVFY